MKDFLVDILHAKENSRARSNQKEIGPSELGGCRRKVWYKLNEQPETNDNELKLAAIMGTAIHGAIENALATADPSGEKYVVEQEVVWEGMKAHIDLWIPETGDVVDWKTVKKSNLSYFPSKQQRWQVQVYGYLLDKAGKGKPVNVNLVAIARDGNENDIKVHTEPYDPAIAQEALNWLAAIKETEVAPEPERDESYCKFYCKYYDASGQMGCVGLKKGSGKTEDEIVIADPEIEKNAAHYLELDEKIKKLTEERDSYKESLTGIKGVTSNGISITWVQVAGRKTIDADSLIKAGIEIPYKQGSESIRLNIKQTGGN